MQAPPMGFKELAVGHLNHDFSQSSKEHMQKEAQSFRVAC